MFIYLLVICNIQEVKEEKMKRMWIGLAAIFSVVLVALLVTGSGVSDNMANGNTGDFLSGTWYVESQDTYVSEGALESANYTMKLYHSNRLGNDIAGSYIVNPEVRGAIIGELRDGNIIHLTYIGVGDEYVGISGMCGTVSLRGRHRISVPSS
jgi:hypothetical protein